MFYYLLNSAEFSLSIRFRISRKKLLGTTRIVNRYSWLKQSTHYLLSIAIRLPPTCLDILPFYVGGIMPHSIVSEFRKYKKRLSGTT